MLFLSTRYTSALELAGDTVNLGTITDLSPVGATCTVSIQYTKLYRRATDGWRTRHCRLEPGMPVPSRLPGSGEVDYSFPADTHMEEEELFTDEDDPDFVGSGDDDSDDGGDQAESDSDVWDDSAEAGD